MDTNCGDLQKIDRRRKKALESKKNGNGFGQTLEELANRKLLPTPIMNDCNTGTKLNQGRYRVSKNGFKTTGKLTDWSVSGMLPTPTAVSDAKGGCTRKNQKRQNDTLAHSIHGIINAEHGTTSQLNPQFVEEMMGFPIGWTELKD
jgi:hypothetical protein